MRIKTVLFSDDLSTFMQDFFLSVHFPPYVNNAVKAKLCTTKIFEKLANELKNDFFFFSKKRNDVLDFLLCNLSWFSTCSFSD